MTQATSASGPDQALVHHFIRVFGHRPTPVELARYEQRRSRAMLPLSARVRHEAFRLIMWGSRPQP